MKLVFLLLFSSNAIAQTIYLPNQGVRASLTGSIDSGLAAANVHITGGAISASNPSVSATGAAVPAQATFIGANKSGNLVAPLLDGSGLLQVNGSGVTQPVSASSLPLPTGASTSALQTTANSTLSTIATNTTNAGTPVVSGTVTANAGTGTFAISAASLPLPTGAATAAGLTTINTTLGSPFQAGGSIGNSSFGATQSGTWNINNVSGTVSLPTGAATSALQTTGNTSLSTIATNSSKAPISTNGSGSAAGATVSTVATLTAPSNAVGFILQCLDTSTANIRWAVGRTATTTLGQQLQPGRDSGFVPVGANVSIVAESGTQNYDIQWVSQ